MSTTNEPRYAIRDSGSFAGHTVYDTRNNAIILEDVLLNEAETLCDMLNAWERDRQWNRKLIQERDMLRGANMGLTDVIAELQSELDAYKAAEKRLFDAVTLPPSAKIRAPKGKEAQS